jgi:hypothetical protein
MRKLLSLPAMAELVGVSHVTLPILALAKWSSPFPVTSLTSGALELRFSIIAQDQFDWAASAKAHCFFS